MKLQDFIDFIHSLDENERSNSDLSCEAKGVISSFVAKTAPGAQKHFYNFQLNYKPSGCMTGLAALFGKPRFPSIKEVPHINEIYLLLRNLSDNKSNFNPHPKYSKIHVKMWNTAAEEGKYPCYNNLTPETLTIIATILNKPVAAFNMSKNLNSRSKVPFFPGHVDETYRGDDFIVTTYEPVASGPGLAEAAAVADETSPLLKTP